VPLSWGSKVPNFDSVGLEVGKDIFYGRVLDYFRGDGRNRTGYLRFKVLEKRVDSAWIQKEGR
jgi:hypothetical protein